MRIALACCMVVVGALAAPALAQTYPAKPIRLIVPFAPGGSSEIIARAVAAEMSKGLGQQMIVENRPGGAGNIAMGEVARVEPDGYTLILGHIGTLAVNPYMFAKLPYDVDRDFAAIALLARVPAIYVVHESVPAKTLGEFVALAKKEPGKLYYGSAGNGSAGHLAFEYLKLATGIDVQHVPYKGTGPNITDLVAGRTQASSAGTPPLLPHIKAGKIRAIAVGTRERLGVLPDVGTVAEQGYAGFETSQWYGLNAPAKTPPAVVTRLADEANKALKSAFVTERFSTDGALAAGGTPAAYAEFIKAEQKRWSEVVRKAAIKAE
jgi:tripartite-type tricarboxylate transporter receptor subunit TctC